MHMNSNWSAALESIDDYCRNSFDLPADHSVVSPVARVILQKRRLLKIQEIHNALLKISPSGNQQTQFELEFLTKFSAAFANIRWNELNSCEAQAFASLITDTLVTCKADVQTVNIYMKMAIAEIQGPNLKNRQLALAASMILARAITKNLPKQASMRANDLIRSVLSILNNVSKNHTSFDCIIESLKCLRTVLELPGKFIDTKLKVKIPSVLSKYLKATSVFISIEAAKVLEIYMESLPSIKKDDIKNVLEYLDGSLSSRLVQYKCSQNLLVFPIVLKSSESAELNENVLRKNIERILNYKNIDDDLLSSALAEVLVFSYSENFVTFLSNLLPIDGSKKSVSPKCFAKTVQYGAYRLGSTSKSIHFIRTAFEVFLCKNFNFLADNYSIELINSIALLQETFSDCLTESDFSSFRPLSLPNPRLQDSAADLIVKVLENKPTILASQITLIFAQLKGDFLRLKHKDVNVIKDAVNGLLKLFSRILDISIMKYSNYCDHLVLVKVCEWIQITLNDSSEIEWLKDEVEIIGGLLKIISIMTLNGLIDADITISALDNFCELSGVNFCGLLLEFMLEMGAEGVVDVGQYDETFEKCLHHVNTTLPIKTVNYNALVKFLKIYNSQRRNEKSEIAMFCFVAKLLAFSESSGSGSDKVVANLVDIWAKLFWRCPSQTQDYVLTMWFSSLKNMNACNKNYLLKAMKSIIDCNDINFENSDHQIRVIEQIQSITREFINESDFETRLECGTIIGLIIKLSNEEKVMNQLFEQIMKHAMKDHESNKLSRVCYIMALVSFRANMSDEMSFELKPNALLGLLASLNRESSNICKEREREIRAASLIALAYYVDKCGCSLNSEFYRDVCELLLENFFTKTRCELMVLSIKEVCQSLSLYLNLLPSQSAFITKTLRLILESGYLNHYNDLTIQLACEMSGFNPQIAEPSLLIYKILKSNIKQASRRSFGKICQYLSLQISFEKQNAYDIIDVGLLESIIRCSCMHEYIDKNEYDCFVFFIEKLMALTLIDRFQSWNAFMISLLCFSGNENQSKASTGYNISLGEADAVIEEEEAITENLSTPVSFMLLKPLANRLILLSDLDFELVKSFFNTSVKISFNIISENPDNRVHFLSGMKYLRSLVQFAARINIRGKEFESLIEGSDPQIISIVSSALRFSDDGDPFYAACAFGSFFNYILIRKCLQSEAKSGTGRISGIYNKAKELMITKSILWDEEVIDNLTGLSILIGFCSLIADDHSDAEIADHLKTSLNDFFKAYHAEKIEKNLKQSLSSQDRLVLVEAWLKLYANNSFETDAEVFDGIIMILSRMGQGGVEKICHFSKRLFLMRQLVVVHEEHLTKLCSRIFSYGLEFKDFESIECLLMLSETKYNDISKDFLNKIAVHFLTERFGDFDGEFGIWVLKSQISLMEKNQKIVFEIIDKLVSRCLNEIEVNNSKDMLKCMKDLTLCSNVDYLLLNELIIKWILRLVDVESTFLNQLLFFSVSSKPEVWDKSTLGKLSSYFESMTKTLGTLELSLDSWILLIKAQSKITTECEGFDSVVENCTLFVTRAFEKNRGSELDQVWERIFSLSASILNSSPRPLAIKKEFIEKSLEDLNEFK